MKNPPFYPQNYIEIQGFGAPSLQRLPQQMHVFLQNQFRRPADPRVIP